jgi:hypothetical protein
MLGINYGWLDVWVRSQDWLIRKLEICDYVRHLGGAAAPGGVGCGPCPDFAC